MKVSRTKTLEMNCHAQIHYISFFLVSFICFLPVFVFLFRLKAIPSTLKTCELNQICTINLLLPEYPEHTLR